MTHPYYLLTTDASHYLHSDGTVKPCGSYLSPLRFRTVREAEIYSGCRHLQSYEWEVCEWFPVCEVA